jgi:hypothetical protein
LNVVLFNLYVLDFFSFFFQYNSLAILFDDGGGYLKDEFSLPSALECSEKTTVIILFSSKIGCTFISTLILKFQNHELIHITMSMPFFLSDSFCIAAISIAKNQQ